MNLDKIDNDSENIKKRRKTFDINSTNGNNKYDFSTISSILLK